VVTAVADPDEGSRTAGAKAAAGEVLSFADHRDLLASGACDAVVLASPNMTHVDVLRDILATDLPVLVEKPLGITVEECREIQAMADKRQALVWVGLEYRYMPPVARLIRELASGVAGTTHMVSIREHRFPFLTKVDNWNRFRANTGGTLVEKCCHFFDLMTHLAGGRPVRVIASGGQSVNHLDEVYDGRPSDILDNAYVIVEYDNGVRGLVELCMFAEATYNQEEISVVGDKGKLEALLPENVVRIGRRDTHFIGDVEIIPVVDESIPYLGHHHGSSYVEHTKFAEAIRNGSGPEVSLADGMLAVAVGVAAHRSIDEARPVTLDEVL
jgi:predicted dehydrogenase